MARFKHNFKIGQKVRTNLEWKNRGQKEILGTVKCFGVRNLVEIEWEDGSMFPINQAWLESDQKSLEENK